MSKKESKNSKNSKKIAIDLKINTNSVNSQNLNHNQNPINQRIKRVNHSSNLGPKKKSKNTKEINSNVNQQVNVEEKEKNIINETKHEIKYEPIVRDDLFEKIKQIKKILK